MKFNLDTLAFEDKAHNPKKNAFACSNGDLTWKELEEQVGHISSLFKEINLPKGHPVIIYGHKEKSFPGAITACLAYGVPYIPIDVVMPPERVQKICSISGSCVVVNCTGRQMDMDVSITIDSDYRIHKKSSPDYSKAIYTHSSGAIAYIIFTSGSTGEPKGVMIPIHSVRSFKDWLKRDYLISESTVFMNQAPFSFDLSLVELYATLHFGATAVLNDSETTRTAEKFIERIKKYKCSYWNSTPSFAYIYLTSPLFNENNLAELKHFLFIGEELTSRLVTRVRNNFPSGRIYNAYGPTEATYATTLIEITPEINEKYGISLPIGYSKSDSEIIIENESGDESKDGEIIIAGDNVGAGYLNRPDLTSERFFVYKSKRAFRTGDYGYKKDDIVFFNGRRDEQVKLNGYRIEIGDITQQLENIGFISEAVTVPLKAGTQVKKIISFVRLKDASASNREGLKIEAMKILKSKLPEYMVPSDIVFIDIFPVNSNHKIDKKKLVDLYMS